MTPTSDTTGVTAHKQLPLIPVDSPRHDRLHDELCMLLMANKEQIYDTGVALVAVKIFRLFHNAIKSESAASGDGMLGLDEEGGNVDA